MDEFFRKVLADSNDPRQVVTDPDAVYYGISPTESAMVPDDDATLGATTYADWSAK
jgi:hypothetical protein